MKITPPTTVCPSWIKEDLCMKLTPGERLRAAYVEWIADLETREWYCHSTFRDAVHPEQANN